LKCTSGCEGMAVYFSFAVAACKPDKESRKIWIEFAQSAVNQLITKKTKLRFVFMADDQLLEINRQFLAHDDYTDIITFPLEESDSHLSAEIYISLERVADNARHFGLSFGEELARVMVHGILHLSGLGDKTVAEKKHMRLAEQSIMDSFKSLWQRSTWNPFV
jgi:probable rRNA maturation factor